MFEKEAEEIANKRCHEIMCYGHCSFSSPKHHRCGEWHREYNCAKEGIEFGYNKANEWHYVKDEGTPTKDNNEYFLKVEVYHYQHASSTEHEFINAASGKEAFIKAKEIIKDRYSNQGDSWQVTEIALLDIHRL